MAGCFELKERRKRKQEADSSRYLRFGGLNVLNNNSCCSIFILFILVVC